MAAPVIPPPPDAPGAIPPPPDADRPHAGRKLPAPFGLPAIKNPLDVMLNPEGGLETALSIPMNAAMLGGAGTLAEAAGLPALVGKMAAGGAVGVGQALTSGQGSPTLTGLLDAALASAGELVGGKAGAVLGRAAKGFEGGTKAIKDAFAAVASRLPGGKWLNVPSLAKGAMTAQEAVDKLLASRGNTFKQALAEIRSEFNRLDMQRITGPKPLAGTVFKSRVPDYRIAPSALSRLAHTLAPAAGTALGAQAITPVQGVPLGAIEGAAAMDVTGRGFGALASHVLPHLVP